MDPARARRLEPLGEVASLSLLEEVSLPLGGFLSEHQGEEGAQSSSLGSTCCPERQCGRVGEGYTEQQVRPG